MPDQNPRIPTTDGVRYGTIFHERQLPPIRSDVGPDTFGDPDRYPSHSDLRLTHLYAPHHANSASSNESASASGDFFRTYQSDFLGQQGGSFGSPTLQNPKRAYRQRRKDPSCDACRERKVKCDATETTSCTECLSRHVRCQFTKDSNRRMSSMKQVQDLERQLQEVKQQLEEFRAAEQAADAQIHISAATESSVDIPKLSRSPQRIFGAQPSPEFLLDRSSLFDVGRGLIKPLLMPAASSNPDQQTLPLTSLPSRDVAQHCLDAYLDCVHRRFPVLSWPGFCRDLWEMYSRDPSLKVERERVALSFGVLALGALYTRYRNLRNLSETFLGEAYAHLDVWTDKIGINQGLVSFLISIYMYDVNRRSTSSVWLSSAIRIAQDRGYHVRGGGWSSAEGNMRRRVWYSLYVWDRVIAIETDRPMLINDDDCDAEYPETFDEESATPSYNTQTSEDVTCLLASIQVARLLSPLAKICRSPCITADSARRFESGLVECMSYFPPQLQPTAPGSLDPTLAFPIIYFQNARLFLYRHNLSPACPAEQRSVAIDNCTRTAQDTVSIISRFLQPGDRAESPELRISSAATSLTCMHLWRCMLFLAFRGLWTAFFILLQYSALIGDERPVNINCGRYIVHFLRMLIDRHQKKIIDRIEPDEEIIVFLSGDLQGGLNSWIWNERETDIPPIQQQRYGQVRSDQGDNKSSHLPNEQMRWDSALTEEEIREWGGWDKVRETAQYLERLQQEAEIKYQSTTRPETMPSLVDRSRDQPSSNPDVSRTSAKSRMTIASLTQR